MPPELLDLIDQQEKRILDQINDYSDTIYAILGFVNLWLFDVSTRQNRPDVRVFQGRHLAPAQQSGGIQFQNDVCPDLGIVIQESTGIIGEVKKNFPKNDDERAEKIFVQLKSYDQELTGWPTCDGGLPSHSIVLLAHQTTSRAAQVFYNRQVKNGRLAFVRPFSICQFNLSEQRVPYFFFQKVEGEIGAIEGAVDLFNGIQVPMQALCDLHSRSKIYDAEPPLPYLVKLIWEHVVIPLASENPRFARLHSNQKLEINVSIEDIVMKLHEGFSFSHWHTQYPDRQPQVPRKEWVQRACQFLVQLREARWVTEDVELVVFYRKYDDVLAHFVRLQAETEAGKSLQPAFPGFEAG